MSFFYSQLIQHLPYPTGSYAGKTVVVTGSNTGLGKEAARHFARLGASRLILAVRSLDKGRAAKADIEASVPGLAAEASVVQVWQLDMGSYASVQAFAARVDTELDRVDVFLANAGLARARYSVVEDNEEMITVNVVATFLLAALVMPKLKSTAAQTGSRPTLTITSSGVHGHTQFPQKSAPHGRIFATINDKTTAERHWAEQYPVSKLLEVLCVRALAERHPALPVTVNCVNPGLCQSELARDVPGWAFWLRKLLLARSTEAGSRTLVHAASPAVAADSHGQYLSDCAVSAPAPLVTGAEGKEAQDRVWEELVAKLEAIRPGVMKNL
ncbi:short chain dehydrogenase [Hirsutella rhossiliensis]|uniref:Short chain dehydrogenase domain-containing protein n=1 Tax=Hirsutella rhossiliensis TaxID=111463 RepID=A0A9P8N1E9_9HYPO|nr:short chain dehydrogenase domain-containing protein [Hirsutella rhossiliensis]KAH0965100.1 short chain dehydrogenase domain-containing protein [Hirsutella rhossiliensis]